jgi:hypothetical protein
MTFASSHDFIYNWKRRTSFLSTIQLSSVILELLGQRKHHIQLQESWATAIARNNVLQKIITLWFMFWSFDWLGVFMFAVTTTGWNVFDFQVGYSTCHWYVCQNPSFLKASMTFPLVSKLIWFWWIHSSWRNLVPASLLLNEKSCVIPVDGSAIGLY